MKAWFSCLLSLLLLACSSSPEPSAVPVSLAISAGAELNPSSRSKANPVIIRVYQLNALEPFKSTENLALYQKDSTLLAESLVDKKILKALLPNETRTVALEARTFDNSLIVMVRQTCVKTGFCISTTETKAVIFDSSIVENQVLPVSISLKTSQKEITVAVNLSQVISVSG